MTPTAASLRSAFMHGLDASARVRARRPSVFQVDLPAFMGDGDAAEIYVRLGKRGAVVLTDMGSTLMRMSYHQDPSDEAVSQLESLAEQQGFRIEDGEVMAEVAVGDIMGATLGLLQIEAKAERLAVVTKRRTSEVAAFREQVLELLRDVFPGAMMEPFFDRQTDPEALYKVDALIERPTPLAVAVVPGDLDAERAVGAKLMLQAVAPPRTRWVAVPRDMERLASKTRRRLVREFLPAASSFDDDRTIVRDRLLDLAA